MEQRGERRSENAVVHLAVECSLLVRGQDSPNVLRAQGEGI